jgi:hypothetical protein
MREASVRAANTRKAKASGVIAVWETLPAPSPLAADHLKTNAASGVQGSGATAADVAGRREYNETGTRRPRETSSSASKWLSHAPLHKARHMARSGANRREVEMEVKSAGTPLPTGAAVDIHVHVSAPLNITPFVARQTVNAFVVTEISAQLRSEPPNLVVGERLFWSVPVVLTSPLRGVIGEVGEIRVDAMTGEMLLDEAAVRRLSDNVRRLAERSPL